MRPFFLLPSAYKPLKHRSMKILIVLAASFLSFVASAQQQAYFDPAQAFLKLSLDKGASSISRIGAYKVKGTPYLYGTGHPGSVKSAVDSLHTNLLSYNAYNQEVEIVPSNSSTAVAMKPGLLSSFTIEADASLNILADLKFIYGGKLGSSEKRYFQEMHAGPRFTLYKAYSAELANPSSGYIDSDLREFQIRVDYYYVDSTVGKLQKIKPSAAQIIKEFKKIKDLSAIVNNDELVSNRDMELTKIFIELNN
jgi:hypothetical protein